jgi:hypothetical protein
MWFLCAAKPEKQAKQLKKRKMVEATPKALPSA